jgi:hypothetical protein
MANEDDANRARREHGRVLMQQGVHAIGVEEGVRHGKRGWVVIAHVAPQQKVDLPPSLPLSTDKGTIEVPLVIEHSEPFMPE